MLSFLHVLPLPLLLLTLADASHPSTPEDLFAFPRYSVNFLNGLPVDNETAQTWLTYGLKGGLAEFLGQSPPDSIESGDHPLVESNNARLDNDAHSSLQFMRMGQNKAFICYYPPPPSPPSSFSEESQVVTPAAKTWRQLSALAGTCLYHRQGWFTYSYCHNMHVRQFKEAALTHVGQIPQEDPEWESFTLGRSPTADASRDQLSDAEETALAQNLEIARGARQRYLVQRWGEGTVCDKTGRHREIEVQFHCSTTTTDTIMFVKETSTCKYSLVIHTPRLCGEPGFMSRAEQTEAAPIRCRHIMDNPVLATDGGLHESAHPVKQAAHPSIAGSKSDSQPSSLTSEKEKKKDFISDRDSFLKKLIDSLKLRAKELDISLVSMEEGDNGEQYWILEGDEDILSRLSGEKVVIEQDVDTDDGKETKHSQQPNQQHEDL